MAGVMYIDCFALKVAVRPKFGFVGFGDIVITEKVEQAGYPLGCQGLWTLIIHKEV